MRKYHVQFWRAVRWETTSLTLIQNASKNLERWHPEISFPTTSSSEERNACGELNNPAGQSSRDSLKQEVDMKPVQFTLFDTGFV